MSNTPYVTTSTSNVTTTASPAQMGANTTDSIAFFGATPTTRRAASTQATLSIGTITNSSPYGFASQADGNAVVNQVKEIAATLTALGLWKGGA